jgi:DNA-binding transcriptional ArsR family regulator
MTSQNWTLMASHGVVLFYVAANPESTMREMADALEMTERRIAGILKDLEDAGMINVNRVGRKNAYSVNHEASFRHPTLSHVKLKNFVHMLTETSRDGFSSTATNVLRLLALPVTFGAWERGAHFAVFL